MYRKSASGAFRGRVGYHFADQGSEVHFSAVDHLPPFIQPGDRRYVLQQLPEPFGLGETLFEEGPLRRCVDVRIGDESFEVAVDGTYGGFQLVVDVVGQLPLDADFFLFLVQCGGMFAVAFCEGRPHLNHVFRELADHIIADQTQQQGDRTHEPQKVAVGVQHLRQRYRVG